MVQHEKYSTAPASSRKRRRRPTAARAAVPFALVASAPSASSASAALAAQQRDGHADVEPPPLRRSRPQHAQRRLERRTRETVASWRSLRRGDEEGGSFDLADLRPLDLVLDETDPARRRAYQKGDGGFLEPYDFVNYQSGFAGTAIHLGAGGGTGARRSGGGGAPGGGGGKNDGDGARSGAEGTASPEERRRRPRASGDSEFERGRGIGRNLRGPEAAEDPSAADPEPASIFVYTQSDDPEEAEEYEVVDDHFDFARPSDERRLQSSTHHHGKSSSAAHDFVRSIDEGEEEIVALKKQDSSPPVIRSTFPPPGTSVGAHQTFGALVSDDGSGVRKVCLQFMDHERGRSRCFKLFNVGTGVGGDGGMNVRGGRKARGGRNGGNNGGGQQQQSDVWQLQFEGFEPYAGQQWQYRIKSMDSAKNRRSTRWKSFAIDAGAAGGTETAATTSTTTATSTADADTVATGSPVYGAQKLTREVKDEDWPHGGIVQSSTGRILFFFDGNPYVCTGTVVQSAPSDRTIIVTAGHCAYQYRPTVGGRFAERALFIPNQVDTRGARSNEICSDDPLGCWIPAFAVVHYEWTTKGFPDSVPWDYAYYVVPNDPGAHEGGFIHEDQAYLSKVLEEIVEPLPIDFEWQLANAPENTHLDVPGEFTHGLGYSFNKDPAFRYCSTSMTTKFGIRTYENLWLESCEMTGGSSGGPWMIDVDDRGRGIVVSVNSWGYATSPGMGGPNFSVGAGGHARCLYERARDAEFDEVIGTGIVVDDCP